jgi:hypothetical protein
LELEQPVEEVISQETTQDDLSIETIEARLNATIASVSKKTPLDTGPTDDMSDGSSASPEETLAYHDDSENENFPDTMNGVSGVSSEFRKSVAQNLSRQPSLQEFAARSIKDFAVWAARRQLQQSQHFANSLNVPVATDSPQTKGILVLRNPNYNRGPIAFLMDGRVVTLKPGEETVHHADEPHTIQFHRGGDHGVGNRSLLQGTHEFKVTSQGWNLEAVND